MILIISLYKLIHIKFKTQIYRGNKASNTLRHLHYFNMSDIMFAGISNYSKGLVFDQSWNHLLFIYFVCLLVLTEHKATRRDFRNYDKPWQLNAKKPKKSKSDLAVSNISPPSPESKSCKEFVIQILLNVCKCVCIRKRKKGKNWSHFFKPDISGSF